MPNSKGKSNVPPQYLCNDTPGAGFQCSACHYVTNNYSLALCHAEVARRDPTLEYRCLCQGFTACTALGLIDGHLKSCSYGQSHFPGRDFEDRWMHVYPVSMKCERARSVVPQRDTIKPVGLDQAANDAIALAQQELMEEIARA